MQDLGPKADNLLAKADMGAANSMGTVILKPASRRQRLVPSRQNNMMYKNGMLKIQDPS